MRSITVLLAFVAVFLTPALASRSVNQFITDADTARYQQVFADGLKSSDIQSVYYSTLNTPRVADGDKAAVCKRLLALHTDSKLNEFEKNFYLVSIHRKFGCSEKYPTSIDAELKTAFGRNYSTSQEVYFTYFAAKALAVPVSAEQKVQISRNLQLVLKKDDSLLSTGHALFVAAELGTNGEFALKRIEGTIAQADEVDGKYLQFEGGLSITSLVLSSCFKLTTALGKPAPITAEQATKFTAYFLSRRSVQTPKGVSALLEALKVISEQTALAPAAIQLTGNGKLQPEKPVFRFRAVDVFGKALKPTIGAFTATVTAKTTKKDLVAGTKITPAADGTTFELDLAKLKPEGGHYIVRLESGVYRQEFLVSILQRAKIASLEVGVGDSDSSSAVRKQAVTYPNALTEPLSADVQQKIILKASIVEERSGAPLTVHQAFVRLSNAASAEEIIFIAEQDAAKAYKFDMDVGARAADFGHRSGTYSIELILGDSLLANSLTWRVGDVQLKFGTETRSESAPLRHALPEIQHKFREPEKRPPRIISDLFTGLVLAPMVLLFALWLRLHVNLSNFPFSLSAICFHGGLGAILGLYFLFWLRLNMFETLRYLLPLGLFTFLAGNRLLRTVVLRRLGEK